MMVVPGSLGRLGAIASVIAQQYGSFTPASLFTTGVNGVWYDPSDFTTLYQDAAGTTPVTAMEQPVGPMLDKSRGLVLGPELVTNPGSPYTSTSGWTSSSTFTSTASVSSGYLAVTTIASYGRQMTPITCVVGKTYRITTSAYVTNGIYNAAIAVGANADGSSAVAGTGTSSLTDAPLNLVFTATATTMYVGVGSGTTGIGVVTYFKGVSVRELPGNHAFNPSGNSANFPVLSARYNLLTKSEDISAADWTKGGATAASTSSLLETATTGVHSCTLSPTTVAATYIYSVKLKANGRTRFAIAGTASLGGNLGNGIFFDLSTGSYVSGATGTPSITALSDGWYQVTYMWTALAGSGPLGVYLADSGTNTSYTGDVTKGMFIKEADLRVANDALNQPAYQRVNTATDYDTVGFKPAEVFDGVDDNLIASAGGGSTTAFFWCSAIRVGKVGAVQTLFSDAGTNTGYRVRINASNQLELSAGNGTAYTTVATTTTLSIGQRAVLTAWHDGTNLNVQINNGTVHQAAFATATAGTAQFTIGKDNNAASNFFAGRLYEKVYTKDNVPSSAQITSTKTYVANVAGITLS